jgi:hypothetical protein
MNEFTSRYSDQISGVITGFDRLVFRGNLSLIHDAGMKGYLWANGVAWKDYAEHVADVSRQVKLAALAPIESAGRPVRYLSNGKESKEEIARAIALQDGITSGPICALTAVEPCLTWRVAGNRETKKLRLIRDIRQCLFVYHYWIDAVFGFMSARLQTWFPFALYVYMNGRAWLARQMDQAGMRYQRHDNCFSWTEDFSRAQALMDEQLKTDWATTLNGCASRIHPLFPRLTAHYPMQYHWTVFQSEWAMDIVFRDPEFLRRLYPQLIHLGMVGLSSPDVMRFMGKKVSSRGNGFGPHAHEVISDMKVRSEGVRIKHRLGKNSIKLYDKAYAVNGAVASRGDAECAGAVPRVSPQSGRGRRPHEVAAAARRHCRSASEGGGFAEGPRPLLHSSGAGRRYHHAARDYRFGGKASAPRRPVRQGAPPVRERRSGIAARRRPRRVHHQRPAQPRPAGTAVFRAGRGQTGGATAFCRCLPQTQTPTTSSPRGCAGTRSCSSPRTRAGSPVDFASST